MGNWGQEIGVNRGLSQVAPQVGKRKSRLEQLLTRVAHPLRKEPGCSTPGLRGWVLGFSFLPKLCKKLYG
jgi:hypothetical protein